MPPINKSHPAILHSQARNLLPHDSGDSWVGRCWSAERSRARQLLAGVAASGMSVGQGPGISRVRTSWRPQ
jgi:hypothetical protein